MSDVAALLARAARSGVRIDLDDGRLRCRAPAGVIDPDLRAALAERRDALCAHLARAPSEAGEGPLSPGQEAMFFDCLLDPESTAYNMDVMARIVGAVDRRRLADALDALTARHPALRVRMVDRDGPCQAIAPPGAVSLLVPPPGAAARAALEAFLTTPFEVEGGALFRAGLFEVAPDTFDLCLSLHHLVGDALSLDILMRDLVGLYATAGTPLTGGTAVETYLDLAGAELRWSRSPEHDAMLATAVAALTDPLPPPSSFGSQRGDEPAGALARECFTVPEAAVATLDARARAAGATGFEWLLATFSRAAATSCSAEDLVVGVITASRPESSADGVAGYFVNAVPVRLRGGAGEPIERTVDRTRQAFRAARTRARLPLAAIRRALASTPWPATRPVFDVAFTHVGLSFSPAPVAGLTVTSVRGVTRRSKFPVNVQVQHDGGALAVAIHHDPGCVPSDHIRSLASEWRRELDVPGSQAMDHGRAWC